MSIVRLGVFCADFQTEDLIVSQDTDTTSDSFSGDLAYEINSAHDGFVLSVSTTALRSHCFLKPDFSHVGLGQEGVIFGVGIIPDPDEKHIYVVADKTDNTLQLRRFPSLLDPDEYDVMDSINLHQIDFLTQGVWHSAGFHISGGHTSFYWDGEKILSGDGASDTILYFYFGGRHSLNSGMRYAYYDDLYLDSVVGEADAPPPPKRWGIKRPSGVGVDAEWTPSTGSNWQNVDEVDEDEDITYNSTFAFDLKDTFEFSSAVAYDAYKPVSVQVSAFAKITVSPSQNLQLHAWDGLTYEAGVLHPLGLSYEQVVDTFLLDNNGDPWTQSSVDSYQFGYESKEA